MGILVEVRIIQRKEERKGWREGKKRETEGKLSQKGDAQTWRASISLLYSQSASLLIHLTPSSPSASKTFLIFRCEKSIEKWTPDPWFRCFCMSTCHIFPVWVFFFQWSTLLQKTLESPLDCKGIQPVHPKGDRSWVFIGRTDAEAETPILRPPHVKSWLIEKDSVAWRDWGQEEKGTIEDEMAGWHHRLDGHEFE